MTTEHTPTDEPTDANAASGPLAVRPVAPGDRTRWAELFRAYRAFYELQPDEGVVDRVWGWISDDAHEIGALVAETESGIVAIAHFRRFSRPSTGTVGIWLDDLFTTPEARGRGAARALIEHLTGIAAAEGRSVVRWITAADNHRAQELYDRVAARTAWVTYDAPPARD